VLKRECKKLLAEEDGRPSMESVVARSILALDGQGVLPFPD